MKFISFKADLQVRNLSYYRSIVCCFFIILGDELCFNIDNSKSK